MKSLTHYLFALGLIHLLIFYFVVRAEQMQLAWGFSLLAFAVACLSLLPNWLDRRVGARWDHNGVLLRRYRHPLTHSPWTGIYFFPLWYIDQIIESPLVNFLFVGSLVGWYSHLLLDAFNKEGIPLGTKSTITNHPIRHYRWVEIRTVRKLRLGYTSFNDLAQNEKISRIGIGGAIFNLTLLVLTTFLSGGP
ncbi:MAG: hypothetical protein ACFFE8_10370 [Candidatus Heimdallarchaeota archaeon]